MQYKRPSRPPEGINSSTKSPLNDAIFLVGLTIAIMAVAYFTLGIFVDSSSKYLTMEREVKYLQKDIQPTNNEEEQRLQNMVNRLWSHYPESKRISLRASVHSSKEYNAFMIIGGNLSVTWGLLKEIKTENELAFVICHEIGHFYNRDVLQGMGRRVGLATILSVIGLSDQAEFINLGAQSLSLIFDREQESRADSFALDCMNNEFGHVKGYDGFFKLILKKQKFPKLGRKVLSFANTHPMTEDRVTKLKKIIHKKSINAEGALVPFPSIN